MKVTNPIVPHAVNHQEIIFYTAKTPMETVGMEDTSRSQEPDTVMIFYMTMTHMTIIKTIHYIL